MMIYLSTETVTFHTYLKFPDGKSQCLQDMKTRWYRRIFIGELPIESPFVNGVVPRPWESQHLSQQSAVGRKLSA